VVCLGVEAGCRLRWCWQIPCMKSGLGSVLSQWDGYNRGQKRSIMLRVHFGAEQLHEHSGEYVTCCSGPIASQSYANTCRLRAHDASQNTMTGLAFAR
jgi:hypothetical protein